jgi:hypothetical protein
VPRANLEGDRAEQRSFSGQARNRAALSVQPAYALHTHDAVASPFVGRETRPSDDGYEPPPLSERVTAQFQT